ncbi:unnamed protein product [Polarella glacialis]|uniref:Uncharacterized protein n=1 Tax=Polarella glacialis TaxID=89957 RepID=A0A813K9I7_POLGL|nr:unnamed protein product [Polarella glacialis]CAE8696182.1 unnamed protein product [Polarella glacialis]
MSLWNGFRGLGRLPLVCREASRLEHRLPCSGLGSSSRCLRPILAQLERRQPFTNWWHRWVDGKNPDSPNGAAVARFLREEGVNPYMVPRDELEDFRKHYLTQLNWFAKAEGEAREAEAWGILKEKKGHVLVKWQSLYKQPEETVE